MAAVLAALWLQAASAVPVRTIAAGARSDIASARQVIVRSPAEWTALWQEHADSRTRPEVDFSRDMVAAIFLGSRPTPGFGVEVLGVDEAGRTMVIRYRERMPPRDRILAQVITTPFRMIAVPRFDGDVRFEREP